MSDNKERNIWEALSSGDPKPKEHEEQTLTIHEATRRGELEIIKELIKAGKDINAKNNDGLTPLHIAAKTGRDDISQYLLANGADNEVRDIQETTEMNYMKQYQHTDREMKQRSPRTPYHTAPSSLPYASSPSPSGFKSPQPFPNSRSPGSNLFDRANGYFESIKHGSKQMFPNNPTEGGGGGGQVMANTKSNTSPFESTLVTSYIVGSEPEVGKYVSSVSNAVKPLDLSTTQRLDNLRDSDSPLDLSVKPRKRSADSTVMRSESDDLIVIDEPAPQYKKAKYSSSAYELGRQNAFEYARTLQGNQQPLSDRPQGTTTPNESGEKRLILPADAFKNYIQSKVGRQHNGNFDGRVYAQPMPTMPSQTRSFPSPTQMQHSSVITLPHEVPPRNAQVQRATVVQRPLTNVITSQHTQMPNVTENSTCISVPSRAGITQMRPQMCNGNSVNQRMQIPQHVSDMTSTDASNVQRIPHIPIPNSQNLPSNIAVGTNPEDQHERENQVAKMMELSKMMQMARQKQMFKTPGAAMQNLAIPRTTPPRSQSSATSALHPQTNRLPIPVQNINIRPGQHPAMYNAPAPGSYVDGQTQGHVRAPSPYRPSMPNAPLEQRLHASTTQCGTSPVDQTHIPQGTPGVKITPQNIPAAAAVAAFALINAARVKSVPGQALPPMPALLQKKQVSNQNGVPPNSCVTSSNPIPHVTHSNATSPFHRPVINVNNIMNNQTKHPSPSNHGVEPRYARTIVSQSHESSTPSEALAANAYSEAPACTPRYVTSDSDVIRDMKQRSRDHESQASKIHTANPNIVASELIEQTVAKLLKYKQQNKPEDSALSRLSEKQIVSNNLQSQSNPLQIDIPRSTARCQVASPQQSAFQHTPLLRPPLLKNKIEEISTSSQSPQLQMLSLHGSQEQFPAISVPQDGPIFNQTVNRKDEDSAAVHRTVGMIASATTKLCSANQHIVKEAVPSIPGKNTLVPVAKNLACQNPKQSIPPIANLSAFMPTVNVEEPQAPNTCINDRQSEISNPSKASNIIHTIELNARLTTYRHFKKNRLMADSGTCKVGTKESSKTSPKAHVSNTLSHETHVPNSELAAYKSSLRMPAKLIRKATPLASTGSVCTSATINHVSNVVEPSQMSNERDIPAKGRPFIPMKSKSKTEAQMDTAEFSKKFVEKFGKKKGMSDASNQNTATVEHTEKQRNSEGIERNVPSSQSRNIWSSLKVERSPPKVAHPSIAIESLNDTTEKSEKLRSTSPRSKHKLIKINKKFSNNLKKLSPLMRKVSQSMFREAQKSNKGFWITGNNTGLRHSSSSPSHIEDLDLTIDGQISSDRKNALNKASRSPRQERTFKWQEYSTENTKPSTQGSAKRRKLELSTAKSGEDASDHLTMSRESSSERRERKSKLLSEIANSEGYVAEKISKRGADDLYEDPSKLDREARWLQRAMLQFSEMEQRERVGSVTSVTQRGQRLQSGSVKKAAEIKRKAIHGRHHVTHVLTPVKAKHPCKEFHAEILPTRTRNIKRQSLDWFRYTKDAAYDAELSRDEERRRKRRDQRLAMKAKRESMSSLNGEQDTSAEQSPTSKPKRTSQSEQELTLTPEEASPKTKDKMNKTKGDCKRILHRIPKGRGRGRGRKRRNTVKLSKFENYVFEENYGMLEEAVSEDYSPIFESSVKIEDDMDSVCTEEYGNEEAEGSLQEAPRTPPIFKKLTYNKTSGETVLHRAARMGYEDVVLYCLRTGRIDMNARDNAGYTPLHESCVRGNLLVARYLLAFGADVNCASLDGIRPIHDAVENDHIEIVRLLLSYGADPTLATYSGRTTKKMTKSKRMEQFLDEYFKELEGNVKLPWRCPSSSVFETEESVFGYSILDDAPSDSEAEDAMEFEFSGTPLLPCYNVQTDESDSPENYIILLDVLEHLIMDKDDFLNIHGNLTFVSMTISEFSRHLCKMQIKTECIWMPKDPETSHDYIELVKLDDNLRRILGTETQIISSETRTSSVSDVTRTNEISSAIASVSPTFKISQKQPKLVKAVSSERKGKVKQPKWRPNCLWSDTEDESNTILEKPKQKTVTKDEPPKLTLSPPPFVSGVSTLQNYGQGVGPNMVIKTETLDTHFNNLTAYSVKEGTTADNSRSAALPSPQQMLGDNNEDTSNLGACEFQITDVCSLMDKNGSDFFFDAQPPELKEAPIQEPAKYRTDDEDETGDEEMPELTMCTEMMPNML